MAILNTITLTADDWVDVNTLSGATVGSSFRIQNISTGACFLVDSTTKPVRTDGSVLFAPTYGDLSIADIESGGLKIWARPKDLYLNTVLVVSN
jgi:hypothetical protein